ncbi:MAG: hypothetical protein IPG76_01665 [Acidobacteria bacterium]|nr:hypothetical protein [Acidobacteriota bacterium]
MGTQASRLLVLKYLHVHIRFALIELTQAGRLRSSSYGHAPREAGYMLPPASPAV